MTADPEGEMRLRRLPDGGTEFRMRLAADYPGFQGHFPGDPVLPGMCHVFLATRAAGKACGREVLLAKVLRARFSRKVVPGEELRILLTLEKASGEEAPGGPVRVRSSHSVEGEPAAELQLEVQ